MSIESFIFRIETLQKKNGLSHDQLLTNFHHLVSGPAERWYWQYLEENQGDELLSYFDLKTELLHQFQDSKRDHEILRAIMDRRQLPQESIDEFYGDVRTLILQMTNRPTELDLVDIIRHNLKDRVATLIFGCSVTSIRQLREECRRAEKHLLTRENKFRRQVNELEEQLDHRMKDEPEDLEDEELEVAALQRHRTDRPTKYTKTDKGICTNTNYTDRLDPTRNGKSNS